MARRLKRGRPEEKGIPLSYINALHSKHEKLFSDRSVAVSDPQFASLPVLVLDCDADIAEAGIQEDYLKKVEEFVLECESQREFLSRASPTSSVGSEVER